MVVVKRTYIQLTLWEQYITNIVKKSWKQLDFLFTNWFGHTYSNRAQFLYIYFLEYTNKKTNLTSYYLLKVRIFKYKISFLTITQKGRKNLLCKASYLLSSQHNSIFVSRSMRSRFPFTQTDLSQSKRLVLWNFISFSLSSLCK